MRARYDLSQFITGYDFFTWLVQVRELGALEVVIDDYKPKALKWPMQKVRERIESIIVPGAALAGLPSYKGREGPTLADTHLRHLVDYCRRGNKFTPLKSVEPPRNDRYTVTLRNTQRATNRNSDMEAWRKFAEEIGAHVIEDYDDKPIHLHDRVALYAGATMNFGVIGGPMYLCSLTDYPMMAFCDETESTFAASDIKRGEMFPWMNVTQRLVWKPQDYSTLMRQFSQWHESQYR
jgi:hypothetical protein